MELSELTKFNNKLFTVDDRTGIVYEILENHTIQPWIILKSYFHSMTHFKPEWTTVKDNFLYIGCHSCKFNCSKNDNLNTVVLVDRNGKFQTQNWKEKFEALKLAAGVGLDGYLTHESVIWSQVHMKWFFVPRKCSHFPYEKVDDETRGCNLMLVADENFQDIQRLEIGDLNRNLGFSSIKFIPGTNDNILVGIKTEEVNERMQTFVTVFNVDGNILHGDEIVDAKIKYEGIEFL